MKNAVDLLVEEASGNNPEALKFLQAWHRYCHLVDDIVDGDVSPREVIRVARWANDLYSSPFYQAHVRELYPVVQLITVQYEDSVEMAGAGGWKAQHSDVIRHAGSEMVRVVAQVMGGYELMRRISIQLRELCYHAHHDAGGNPI